jgi:hypothetical protein
MHETCWREAKDRHSKLMNGRQIRGKKTFAGTIGTFKKRTVVEFK